MKKILFENNEIKITQVIKSSQVFICHECGLPGNHPVIMEEGISKYYFHPKCIFFKIKELGGNTPLLTKKEKEELLNDPETKKKLKELKRKTTLNYLIEQKNANLSERVELKKRKLQFLLKKLDNYSLKKIPFNNKHLCKVELKNDKIYIEVPYNKKLIQMFKYLSIGFNRDFKKWEVTKFTDYELLRFLMNINQEVSEYEWMITTEASIFIQNKMKDFNDLFKKHKEILQLKRAKDTEYNVENIMKLPPYGYQKVGMKFMELNDGNVLLADEMGVGKTYQVLGYTAKHNFRTLIVCPYSLQHNWEQEVKKHTYKDVINLSNIKRTDYKFTFEGYAVINYDLLSQYEKLLRKLKIDCIVLDESHYIKDTKSKRTKLILSIFKKVKHKILLSGTPVSIRPIDLYSQLKFLKPNVFRKKVLFGLRYCDAQYNEYTKGYDYKGASNLRELYLKIDQFYLRRLKIEVLDDLPRKTIQTLKFKLTQDERRKYNIIYKPTKLDKLELKDSVKVNQYLSIIKIKHVVKFCQNIWDSNPERKIIIFSQFQQSQNKLIEIFGDASSSLIMKYSKNKRDKEVKEFNELPNKKVMVASIKIGGVGLNLTSSDIVIFLDMTWDSADHKQAEDRVHRIGQKNSVNIFYFLMEKTEDIKYWNNIKNQIDELAVFLA